MQPAAGMQLMKQAIDMMEGVQPKLPDMTDDEWLACLHSFLLPPGAFQGGICFHTPGSLAILLPTCTFWHDSKGKTSCAMAATWP